MWKSSSVSGARADVATPSSRHRVERGCYDSEKRTQAGAGSLSLVYPLDSVRTQLIVCTNADGSPKYASMGDLVRENVKTPGDILRLYEGYAVSVAGIIPFRAIYFIVNDCVEINQCVGYTR